jgi:hypothetical protein
MKGCCCSTRVELVVVAAAPTTDPHEIVITETDLDLERNFIEASPLSPAPTEGVLHDVEEPTDGVADADRGGLPLRFFTVTDPIPVGFTDGAYDDELLDETEGDADR